MKFYLGITDNAWYNYLSEKNPEDVNFWQPGGKASFKVLGLGAPFLFKFRSPINAISGVGFFSTHSILPISMAWEIFGEKNGAATQNEFYANIKRLRSKDNSLEKNPNIGCIVLTNPIFFQEKDWISVKEIWPKSTVQGKSYSVETIEGNTIWNKIQELLQKYLYQSPDQEKNQLVLEDTEAPLYGLALQKKVRLGQSAFRVMVTDAYRRKCTISGEKTLPVLEAAHIKKYSESGPHLISNSLLLRSDIHKLFDAGYITITTDLKVEISKKIKEEYENGREYYKFHGNELFHLPQKEKDRPEKKFIEWHNNTFKG